MFALQIIRWRLAIDHIDIPMDILKEIYSIIRIVSVKQANAYMWSVYKFHYYNNRIRCTLKSGETVWIYGKRHI